MTDPVTKAAEAGRIDARGIVTLTASDCGFIDEDAVLELRGSAPPAPAIQTADPRSVRIGHKRVRG